MSVTFQQLRHATAAIRTGPFGSALSASEYSETGVPLINPSDLKGGRIETVGAVKVPAAVAERMSAYRLRAGDVVVGRRGEMGRYGLVRAEEDGALCGTGSLLVRPSVDLEPRFLGYLLETSLARDWLSLQSVGSTMDNLSEAILARMPVPAIARTKQECIANFLDEQTARIDALIAEKQALLQLLPELQSQAVDAAVLGQDLPGGGRTLKGVEQLGPIPSHWASSRLKYEIEYVTSGSRGWADYYADDGALFVRIGNLTRNSVDLDLSDIQRVALPDAAEGTRTRVKAGDLLISITAYLGSVAVAPPDLEEAYVSQHVALARPSGQRAHPRWLGYVLLSSVGRTFFDLQAYGGTKVQLSLDDVRDAPIPLPPLEAQSARIEKLELRLQQLRGTASHVGRHIDRLREYRSSLISAAVTGELHIN